VRPVFIINTPAQAHTWHYVIKDLLAKGHDVKILAREYGDTISLLKSFGLQYAPFKPKGARAIRFLMILEHLQNCYRLSRIFEPSMVIGFGADAAVTAFRLRKPCIIFTDSEGIPVQNNISKMFSSAIITPGCFMQDLGVKHIFIEGYKEFAYLHPNYFKPNSSIFKELKLDINDKYVIIRINVFDAVHDIGKHGFTDANQIEMVKELEKYAKVFISPEGRLSPELEKYRLPVGASRIHDVLYYSQLLITDTQTMTTEAAILGTPAVRSNNFAGPKDMGIFVELEKKYDMIYSFPKAEQAIKKALTLIKQPDLKEEWAIKRQKLLSDKIDVTKFMVDFIENYPQSLLKYTNSRVRK
jgi:uncharacterized protein